MTLIPSDSPDWTTIPGAGRFLGKITLTLPAPGIVTAGISFVPASYDGAIVLVTDWQSTPTDWIGPTIVFENTTSTFVLDVTQWSQDLGPLVAPVSLAVGADWRVLVSLNGSAPETAHVWVFAVPSYQAVVPAITYGRTPQDSLFVNSAPVGIALLQGWNVGTGAWDKLRAVGGVLSSALTGPLGPKATAASIAVSLPTDQAAGQTGQLVKATSLPVVIASDQAAGRAGQQTMANSLPIVAPSNQPLGGSGQAVMASSLPVVIASDQSALSEGARKPYDSMLVHVPIAATQATVTFPATAGKRWVLDTATWTFHSAVGAANVQTIEVVDGATQIWVSALAILAAADSIDRQAIGPGLGLIGTTNTAMIVRFTAAGIANTLERVAAAAYLIV